MLVRNRSIYGDNKVLKSSILDDLKNTQKGSLQLKKEIIKALALKNKKGITG